jgi:hypothetical protein
MMRHTMVFAVQCPNPKCRKFMLVEEREKTMVCLLCKIPFQIGEPTARKEPPVEEVKEPEEE